MPVSYRILVERLRSEAISDWFTLSCAETKWPEIITAILQGEGNSVSFTKSPWDGKAESICINEVPLNEFCSKLSNRSKLFNYHIVQYHNKSDNRKYIILCEKDLDTKKYWGTYIFRLGKAEPFNIQIPRPLSDLNVLELIRSFCTLI